MSRLHSQNNTRTTYPYCSPVPRQIIALRLRSTPHPTPARRSITFLLHVRNLSQRHRRLINRLRSSRRLRATLLLVRHSSKSLQHSRTRPIRLVSRLLIRRRNKKRNRLTNFGDNVPLCFSPQRGYSSYATGEPPDSLESRFQVQEFDK